MKIRILLCYIVVASIFIVGCTHNYQYYYNKDPLIKTEITQEYEMKRNMSKAEAIQILMPHLQKSYPSLPLFNVINNSTNPNLRYVGIPEAGSKKQVFNSIDENGLEFEVYTCVIDYSSITPYHEDVNYHYNYEKNFSIKFSDVTRIKTFAYKSSQLTEATIALFSDTSVPGNFTVKATDGTKAEISDSLSALLFLCPNVK